MHGPKQTAMGSYGSPSDTRPLYSFHSRSVLLLLLPLLLLLQAVEFSKYSQDVAKFFEAAMSSLFFSLRWLLCP